MSLKQMIHDEIVRPALAGITPTVLGRVTKVHAKNQADIEVPDFARPASQFVLDEEVVTSSRTEIWLHYEKVLYSTTNGVVSGGLRQGDAVWVEFLGHDRTQPRILGRAGRWNKDPATVERGSRQFFEILDRSDTSVTDAGQLIPSVIIRYSGLRG